MRQIFCFILLYPLFFTSILFASDDVPDNDRIATIDKLMERAISNNLITGGVVVIGNHAGILSSTSRGQLNGRPNAPLLDEKTIFDLASLTKVIATAPAVMKLLDEGRISLQDPVTRWFPEFKGSEHENVTIQNLLTHTSGLADFEISTAQPMDTAILKAATEKNRHLPGSSFNYADINFILLGELVHRVSGKTLDVFCHDEIYTPLDTPETLFLPAPDLTDRIAPTLGNNSGTVQDGNSRRLGSVAGHAGLFSSAQDLARFARMMLGGGEIDGKRILSEQTVKQMTSPISCGNGTVLRGLGWDVKSPYSAPKGRLFSECSFGHTGYSGSSIWIDPKQDLFVVVLTNRLEYRNTRKFNQLRRDISTLAVAKFRTPADNQVMSEIPEIARITADLQRRTDPGIPIASRSKRLQAPVSAAHYKMHHPHRKNSDKRLVASVSEEHYKVHRHFRKNYGKKRRYRA